MQIDDAMLKRSCSHSTAIPNHSQPKTRFRTRIGTSGVFCCINCFAAFFRSDRILLCSVGSDLLDSRQKGRKFAFLRKER